MTFTPSRARAPDPDLIEVTHDNLSRAIGTLAGTDLGKARSGTIRRKLITVPARVTTSARKITLRLPADWPWETSWSQLFVAARGPPRTAAI